ncbi:MAG: ribbon-helix-helix protein, CopG family [Vicinamibacterales bacterium]
MTFTLDDAAVQALKRMTSRTRRSQSHVLREALCHYEPYAGQLSRDDRQRRLALLDRVVADIPAKTAAEVDRELNELRRSRRAGWRRSPRSPR